MSLTLNPYPEYKDSGLPWLGEIPAHWEEKRAKYFFREVDERSETGEEELLSVSHLTGVTPHSEKNVTIFEAESYVGHKLVRPGDLAVNTMWAWMAALGVTTQTGNVSSFYGVYRLLNRRSFVPDYLDHLLRTKPYVAEYYCRSTGIRTSRLRLYPDELLDIPVICPPREEQETMVAYLRAMDKQIARLVRAKQQLIELLNEQKQAIIHRAVTRGLDPNAPMKPTGLDWLPEVPEHWETIKLRRLVRLNPSKSETAHNQDVRDKVVFLPMEKVSEDGEIDCSERRALYEVWNGFTYFRRHDVIVAKITPCFENGKGAYLGSLESEFGFGSTEFIVLRAGARILPEFLYQVTASPFFRKFGEEAMSGAAGQQRVPNNFVKNFHVALSPLDEQQAILNHIASETTIVDTAIQRAYREIELIREYRTRLISDVVTGKLDVRGVELPGPEGVVEANLDGSRFAVAADRTDVGR